MEDLILSMPFQIAQAVVLAGLVAAVVILVRRLRAARANAFAVSIAHEMTTLTGVIARLDALERELDALHAGPPSACDERLAELERVVDKVTRYGAIAGYALGKMSTLEADVADATNVDDVSDGRAAPRTR